MKEYFSPEELACQCDRADCDAAPMDPRALAGMNAVRHEAGWPMRCNSGRRCKFQNEAEGGADDSQHPKGTAFDIRAIGGARRGQLVELGIKHGARGIGVAKSFVHLDWREGPLVIWTY